MKAKFAGKCKVCGNRVNVNDDILWFGPRKGVVHTRCHRAIAPLVNVVLDRLEAAKKVHAAYVALETKRHDANRCPKCGGRMVSVGELDGFNIFECTRARCDQWVEVPNVKKI